MLYPVTGDAMGVGMQAYAKAGTDQKKFQGAMAADDRSSKSRSRDQGRACQERPDQEEMMKLTRVGYLLLRARLRYAGRC